MFSHVFDPMPSRHNRKQCSNKYTDSMMLTMTMMIRLAALHSYPCKLSLNLKYRFIPRNLILDDTLDMEKHVNAICKLCYCCIDSICPYINTVVSRLVSCTALFCCSYTGFSEVQIILQDFDLQIQNNK